MKKQIKKYGETLVITFTMEDVRVYGLKVGDIVEVMQVGFFDNEGENDSVVKTRRKEDEE